MQIYTQNLQENAYIFMSDPNDGVFEFWIIWRFLFS